MPQPHVLELNDIRKLAGTTGCPSCGYRFFVLNLNENYYCPHCTAPVSVTVNKKTKPKHRSASILDKVSDYFDKWTLVYSVFYPLVLSIIPLLFIINNNGTSTVDSASASGLTLLALIMMYAVSTVSVIWKSLPNIIAMLVLLAIVVGVLMLFGISPQASISAIGLAFAGIFLVVRIGFIMQNWRAVLVGVILLVSPAVPYLFLNRYVHADNIFTIFFFYHALVANTCLIWLRKNSYTSKQAVKFIGTTPLIMVMLVLPFINKLGLDMDGIYDLETGGANEHPNSLEGEIVVEDPVAAPTQAEVAVPKAPEIIAGPSSGVPHDVISGYYIKPEIIVKPQAQHLINLQNVEVDYYASQQSPDTCAIASQRMILAEQTGVNYSETYLLKYAQKCGYYTHGHGTPLELTGQLLKDAGLEVIESDSVSLEQIDAALQHEYSVSENLDPNEYIHPIYDSSGNPIELPDKMGHNVKVVSINKDSSGAYISVVVDDPVVGPHIEIPVEDYINARSDFGNTVFAKKIV